ncbi:MAG TPA: hypothetical protein VM122_13990 [Usitatibacter sp.]|nr:hypothetical protein [Usitatibacter sp.]
MKAGWWCACVAAIALACPAHAQVSQVDYSDLWWDPAENGWGVGLQRQGDVMFAALFLYGPDGASSWYFASDMRASDAAARSWTGKLYRANGPTFSAPFDRPATVTEIGTAAIDFVNPSAGRLVYRVGGTTITKDIERMTWRVPAIDGSYYGGLTTVVSSCNDASQEGTFDLMGALGVSASNGRTVLSVTSANLATPSKCTFSGTRRQEGRLGAVEGTYTCSIFTGSDDRGENPRFAGRQGSFVMERMALGANGFSAKLVAVDQDCTYTGNFGGVRQP